MYNMRLVGYRQWRFYKGDPWDHDSLKVPCSGFLCFSSKLFKSLQTKIICILGKIS